MLDAALAYLARGFSPIPQRPGAKKPYVPWKEYQGRQPTQGEIESWFGSQFPDAGIALILGPAFHLLAVDVDGEEAHRSYLDRLGTLPMAPTVRSGSGTPFKYHQYFRHPDVQTGAKYTPWHPQLEFRGHRGIVVAPPSLHKSGNRYRWDLGRSPDDLPLPEVPAPMLESLTAKAARTKTIDASPPACQAKLPRVSNIEATEQAARFARAGLSRATRQFLAGRFADGPRWNDRLFRAAADMAGCGFALQEAMFHLTRGARPRTSEDQAAARRTVESAYSQERGPARVLAAEAGLPFSGKRGSFTIFFPES